MGSGVSHPPASFTVEIESDAAESRPLETDLKSFQAQPGSERQAQSRTQAFSVTLARADLLLRKLLTNPLCGSARDALSCASQIVQLGNNRGLVEFGGRSDSRLGGPSTQRYTAIVFYGHGALFAKFCIFSSNLNLRSKRQILPS